ncbi:MAG: TIGR03435 family protein [Vicinamibacterales bacterium]
MRAAIAIGLVVAAARAVGGQETPPPAAAVAAPAFEVASVRANTGRNWAYSMTWLPGGRFRATNMTPRRLIDLAYDLRTEKQLMGAPGWITSERFDIEAIPAVPVARPQQRLMLQRLLRDRFGLVVRPQSVDVPVYALVRTRPEAPLPRTIRELTVSCTTVQLDPAVLTGRGEPPAGDPRCRGVGLDRDGGRIVGAGGQMRSLIVLLSSLVDRRVVDRTGLTGRYDFELTWSPDPGAGSGALANAAIFTAIQDLGLKLQPALNPEQGYVIERIQRPTPN